MVTLVCKQCGTGVEMLPYQARTRKFCSQTCANQHRAGKLKIPQVGLTCQQCGNPYMVSRAWVRNGRRKFCSRQCGNIHKRSLRAERSARYGVEHSIESKARIAATIKARGQRRAGESSPRWKGGRYLSGGYWKVITAELSGEQRALLAPMIPKSGYMMEHRLVVALSLGRPLSAGEVVHHLNGDKLDNRVENLQLVTLPAHSRLHHEMMQELSMLRAENAHLRSLLATSPAGGVTTLL